MVDRIFILFCTMSSKHPHVLHQYDALGSTKSHIASKWLEEAAYGYFQIVNEVMMFDNSYRGHKFQLQG